MKTVILVRHGDAKIGRADKERPLSAVGKNESLQAKEFLKQNEVLWDRMLSSSARRTRDTAAVLKRSNSDYQELDVLYLATRGEILQLLQEQPEEASSIIVIGHNPGMEEICRTLVPNERVYFTTASVAVIDLEITAWTDLLSCDAQLRCAFNP
jgi:phosphohistidine phosphatase